MSSAKCLASGNMPSSKSRGVLCKVCGDEASGFHYGVDSCEGCKGFFRRCLTQGMNHKCAVDERCEITPFSRNSCQFCRLKKCFQVGMSREASRLGRRPKRLKEMNQSNSEPAPHHHPHHRNDKKSFPNITNLFPFTFPFPQIALNMSDLQTFMRNLNTPMGLIASHQTTILPPPPPPSLLSSFYHLENVNMSFFPSSNVSFSTPNYSNASEISSAEHNKKIGKSETVENVTILENNLSLCVPDLNPLFKGPSFMAPNTVGQSLAFASPSLKCYINNNNNNNNGGQNASPVFLNEFDVSASKRNEKISSPQIFSPIIVAGGGANKRFKSNSAGFLPKSYDQHKQNEHFHPNNSHPPKISSSFTVDFLKCSSNLEESKDSPMENNESSLFTNSNFNLEPLMSGFTRTPFRRNLSSPTQQTESNFLKFPINHLAKHQTHSSNHLRRMPSNMTTHPYLTDRRLSDQKNENSDHNRLESKESCDNGSELKDPLGFSNKSGQMFLKRQASSEFFGSNNGSSDSIDAMPMILSIGDSEISFNNQEDYNFIGNNITFNQPNALSSTEFSADKKSLLELPSGKEDEENRNYSRDENDSVISVDDKDQFDEASFCELEFQTGRENGTAAEEEQDGDSGLQEHSTIVRDKLGDGKINEDEWTSLSADMKKQIFLARNTDISQDRTDLINLVESSLISAHMQTCIYTSARVKDGITKFKESNINLCDGLIDLQMSDPLKWWEQFVNNMVPVIKRIVMFSKKLPGFSELNQDDQIVLIKQGSFEVILTRYTQLISEDGMFLPDMSVMVPREKFVHMPLGDFFEEQCKFANDFNKLKLDDYETGILSGIMVMNPERDGLENVRAVQKLQVLYMQALYTYMKRHRSDNYDEHFVKTICSLPKLSRINDLHSKKMQCMKMLCSNGVKMPDLHKEMFHY